MEWDPTRKKRWSAENRKDQGKKETNSIGEGEHSDEEQSGEAAVQGALLNGTSRQAGGNLDLWLGFPFWEISKERRGNLGGFLEIEREKDRRDSKKLERRSKALSGLGPTIGTIIGLVSLEVLNQAELEEIQLEGRREK